MKKSFMERMAAFIVDKRRLFVVLFAVACVLSIFSVSKTDVNNEPTICRIPRRHVRAWRS